MGRVVDKARTWDDRLAAAKDAWVANGLPPTRRAGTRLPGLPKVSKKVAALVVGLLAALFLLPTAGWWPFGLGLWSLPLAVIALAYYGLLAAGAYWLIRTAVEHGVRRALQREVLARLDAPVDR